MMGSTRCDDTGRVSSIVVRMAEIGVLGPEMMGEAMRLLLFLGILRGSKFC